MVDDSHAGDGGNILAAGVDQVLILLAGRSQRPIADDAVFRMKDQAFVRIDVVGAEGRHPYAQVHNPLVLKLHSQAVAHRLALQAGFIRCHCFPP